MLVRTDRDPRRRAAAVTRGIILVGGIIILAMWAVVGASIHAAHEAAMDRTRAEGRNLAIAFADEVSHILGNVAAGMDVIAERMRTEPAPKWDIYAWAHQMPLLSEAARQATIVGADGKVISTTLEPNTSPIDLSDREHFRVPADGLLQGIFIGKPVIARTSKQRSIPVTKRVEAADGTFLGVVVFLLSPSQLTGLHRAIDLGRRGVIGLAGLDNVVRARFTQDNPDGLAGIGQSVAGGPRPSTVDEEGEGSYVRSSVIDGIERLFSYRRIAGYPLVVSVGLDLETALSAARAHVWMVGSITGVATILLLALAIYLIYEIRRRAAHEVALGNQRLALRTMNNRLKSDVALRKETEARLRQAEETLHDAVDSISEAFVIFDRDDRLVMCNDAYRQVFAKSAHLLEPGLLFEDLMRHALATGQFAVEPQHQEEWLADRLAAHRDPPGPLEAQFSDGRWLLVSERRMKNGGIAGLRIDITALKNAEAALRDSKERLERAQRIAGIGTIEVDLKTRVAELSPQMCSILGVAPEDVVPDAEYMMSFVHPDDYAAVEKARADMLATGKVAPPLEYRIVRRDGTVRVVYRENDMILDEAGSPLRRVTTFKDITELKSAETQLREIKDNLDRAQRVAQMGSFERDLHTGKAVLSDEAYRLIGLEPGATPPTKDEFLALVDPEDRPQYAASIQAADDGKPAPPLEYRLNCLDGSQRRIYLEMDVIRDDQGRPVRRIGTMKDVTELRAIEERQKELEAQLQQSQKLEALGTLAGGIAHDLNNILMPILALSDLVMQQLPDQSPQRRDLETIVEAGQRGRDLVQQILMFSRKETAVKAEVELAAVIRQSLQMLRPTVPETIRIIDEIDDVPPVLGDVGQLHQVLVNLVKNAAEAIGAKPGTITVSLSAEAPGSSAAQAENCFVRLQVADTGSGMSKAVTERIFEPFFTTKPVDKGTGLGLSIVHGIVTRHGGRIEVQSRLRKGTIFTIHLPAQLQTAAAESVAA